MSNNGKETKVMSRPFQDKDPEPEQIEHLYPHKLKERKYMPNINYKKKKKR